jgi:hypothetical protein
MKIYLFFIFLFYSTICHAQSINGSYRYKSEDLSESRTIIFSKNYFNEEFSSDLTLKIGTGIYSIRNNQLVLKYQEISNQDTSRYEISASDKSNSSSIIDLKVFDINGKPLIAIYGCRDNKNNPLNFIFTNNNGIGNMTVYNNSSIGYYTIDCVGYHRILIPIKKLMGKTANIIAYLKPQDKYYIEPHTVQYKILKITDKKLMLSEKNRIFIFEKIK